jgi:sec-independent protein translocase protein TatA
MGLSIWHMLIVLAVVLVMFGAGRLPQVMGDLGKGMRSFKAGMNADDELSEKRSDKQLPLSDETL